MNSNLESNAMIMNDYEVMEVLTKLSIRERYELKSVSKQFNECIERLNKSQKLLRIRLKCLERRRHHHFVEDIIISERMVNSLNRIVDINIDEVTNRWEVVLRSLENLEKIELILNTISESVFKWINRLFPDLKTISIQIIAANDWTTTKLKQIESAFSTKCHSLHIKRFRHFDQLLTSKILRMPSLRSIVLSVSPSEESMKRFLMELPVNVTIVGLDNLIYATDLHVLNGFQRTNQIKRLKISFTNSFDGNVLLRFFCKNLPQITDLHIIFGSFNSLEDIKTAKHLKRLTVYPMSVSVIDFGTKKTLISNQMKTLSFFGSYQLKNTFIDCLDTIFPNIRQLKLDNLKIYCNCVNRHKVCFICYQNLLQNCSQLIHRSITKKECFQIELVIENSEPYHKIVLLSMFGLYFNGNQSFKISIKTYRTEYVSVILLETVNTLALKRPDIVFKLFIRRELSYDLDNLSNILSPNLNLEFVDNDYDSKPETNQKYIFLELNSKKDKILVYLGNNSSFGKRFSVLMYL